MIGRLDIVELLFDNGCGAVGRDVNDLYIEALRVSIWQVLIRAVPLL